MEIIYFYVCAMHIQRMCVSKQKEIYAQHTHMHTYIQVKFQAYANNNVCSNIKADFKCTYVEMIFAPQSTQQLYYMNDVKKTFYSYSYCKFFLIYLQLTVNQFIENRKEKF